MHPIHKKKITVKKWNNLLKEIENHEEEKKFNPGEVKFNHQDYPHDKSRVVNFFGDVHTQVFALKSTNDNKYVGAACSNGQVKVYDVNQGKVISIGNTSRLAGYPCTAFQWKPLNNNEYVACNCDGTIRWYNRKSQGAVGHYQNSKTGYLCCSYQSLQEWCAFGTQQSQIEIFDNQTLKPIHTYIHGGADQLSSHHHTNRIFSVKCIPGDKNLFFTGGWDSTIHIWDVRVKEQSIRKIHGPTISSDSLDYKNGMILCGNYRNHDIVQLWDFKSCDLIQTLNINEPQHGNSYCFAASYAHKSESNLIAVALSGTNKVKVLKDKKVMSQIQFQAAPLTLDFLKLNNKDLLAVGGQEGTIYIIMLKQL